MTNAIESSDSPGRFRRGLPWILAAAGCLLYLLTLNHWVSQFNLLQVARLSGWTWQPEIANPIYYLVTLPLKLLPTASIPLGLNLLSAGFAGLALLQLARCVLLLPHDRTHEQREREVSDGAVFTGRCWWLPPTLAVVLCGLQLTFWEQATNGTSEMLDLLLFAYVVRSVLEYRFGGQERWLARGAFVLGAAMSNNPAMLGFFPVFLVALVWVRGVSFFNTRFLLRTFLCGLAGLSFYLLLPLISSVQSPELASFWGALKANIVSQFQLMQNFPRRTLVLLSLTSMLPIAVIGIRWASYFGDTSQTGQLFATTMFHLVHAFFLGAACWLALDPPFAPRNAGWGFAFLPFYFMGALGAGYFSGYFLLVFGPRIERRMRRPPTPVRDKLHVICTAGVLLLMAVMPVALVLRNFADLRLTNGPMVRDYASRLTENLPAKGILISDEPGRQFLAQAALTAKKRAQDYIVLNSDWLKWDSYHEYLHSRHGTNWPAPPQASGRPVYNPQALISLLGLLAQSNRVFYLHPSFGYYFEVFRVEPTGLVYELKPYDNAQLLPPPLSAGLLASNNAFFSELTESALQPILAVTDREGAPAQYFGGSPLRRIRLRAHRNTTAVILGMHLSRAVNYWGVEVQRAGGLTNAARWFDLAFKLNADNVVAKRNLEFNRQIRAGTKLVVELPDSVENFFGAGRSWDQVLSANGPYDEPSLRLMQGYQFLQTGLYRQAAQNFDRVRHYSPTDLPSRIWLAQLHLMYGQPEAALELTGEVHAHAERFTFNSTNRLELLSVEATAHFVRKDTNQAVALIEKAIAADPKDSQLLGVAITLYNQNQQYSNSFQVVDRMLALNADDPAALLYQGFLYIQFRAYDQSLVPLNKLLTLQTNNPYGLFNRALAYFSSDRLNEAKADYETLVRLYPAEYQPYYGLTEIALRRGDTNAAIRYAENFLNTAATNTAEYAAMTERLRGIRGENPK